jgi:hypothetical protein
MSGVQGIARPTSGSPSYTWLWVLIQLAIDLMRLDVPTDAKYKC